ncbi:hypothetical protein U3A58_13100 [Algoriphagus sp. C2-6-M1]|uniref:hypothetical protein n=1 Tax=Algoriphagus persicinus TaxID=3108754 RepID=UPI002B37C156|nr:hypothetical protein [Algoriphagus sp. C2-6-M1]MEB2781331.1 hypothetical protein [Algoriphagus sp. C2-6-M1]
MRQFFLDLRNYTYTGLKKKYGEKYALSDHRFHMSTHFLSAIIFVLAMISWIYGNLTKGRGFPSELSKTLWILGLLISMMIIYYFIFRAVYSNLIKPEDAILELEGEDYKRIQRKVLLLVFGPMILMFMIFGIATMF